MDPPADTETLEERLDRSFAEFQKFRSQRSEQQIAARDEYDAGQKDILTAISSIHNDKNQGVEERQKRADTAIRQLQKQTDLAIKQLRDEAMRKSAELRKESDEDIEDLRVTAKRKTDQLDVERASKKRKHESDKQKIEREFHQRLKTLETSLTPSTEPALRDSVTGSSSSTRENPHGLVRGPDVGSADRSSASNASPIPPMQQSKPSQQSSASHTVPRTLSFDEVSGSIQETSLVETHPMAQSPREDNKGYLQRCAEDALNLEVQPISSVERQTHLENHRSETLTKRKCVANPGVLVPGGHSKKAKRRNRSYRRSLGDSYRPMHAKKTRNERRRAAAKIRKQLSSGSTLIHNESRPAESLKRFEGIVNPVPGEIYQVFQRSRGNNENSWYLVVRLPLSDW
ncbi:hypothetical protein Daus18300_009249 [Diaporthe australafricana]|uniref:Uncharacterized protein n=1 Tax=Diaporthe australafricana TaxID=127596 RepID=A0ABR3WF16_9PEZI